MRCDTRSQRETDANIVALLLVLVSGIAAFRWNPLYGPWLWILGWGAALLVAMVTVVAVAGLRSAHERCKHRLHIV
jgi:fatty acid desaturase